MDRRGFLHKSAAVAVTVAAAHPSPLALAGPARASSRAARRLGMALAPGFELAGSGAARLTKRLELAMAGRIRIERVADPAASDLSFGDARRHLPLHPGFAYFAGLPGSEGLPPPEFCGWLALGGGQQLWDELGCVFGFKPLLVGHSGAGLGLWSNVRLTEVSDLNGLSVAAAGLGARQLARLGAQPVDLAPPDLKAALATGRVEAADGQAAALELRPLAQRLYTPGLHRGGVVLTLTVARGLWDDLTPAEQAIFEACAAEEHRSAAAEASLHAPLASDMALRTKWPLRQAWPRPLQEALDAAARLVLDDVAEHDASCRRIGASYRAHRRLCGRQVSA
jgi:TRAP-type mannitol/chloroaromatic compound transport system substrate-binding protein